MTVEQLAIDFDAPAGHALADQGMATAIEHTEAKAPGWTDIVLAELRVYAAKHRRFPLEQFRMDMAQRLPRPASHYAWGSLGRIAALRGILRFTGEYQPARSEQTHGHDVKVWEVVL